jgi:hypothetical protein
MRLLFVSQWAFLVPREEGKFPATPRALHSGEEQAHELDILPAGLQGSFGIRAENMWSSHRVRGLSTVAALLAGF